ncbi:MAG TPA: fibronectin type III domain-containing protein [Terriglobia bacterium]|nr:fibronectin type III domain-containing protein [Terriglobia bacterium]
MMIKMTQAFVLSLILSVPSIGGPSAPLKLKAQDATSSSITLYWEAPKDKGTGLDGFNIYRDDSVIATVSSFTYSYRDSGLEPSTSYVYKIVAFDKEKLMSPPSASATAKTKNAPKGSFTRVSSDSIIVRTPPAAGPAGKARRDDAL